MPHVAQSIQERGMDEDVIEREEQGPLGKRQSTNPVVHGFYNKTIFLGVTLTDPEIERTK